MGNRGQFTYDLAGDEAEAEVRITVDGKSYNAADLHLEGDIGKVKLTGHECQDTISRSYSDVPRNPDHCGDIQKL